MNTICLNPLALHPKSNGSDWDGSFSTANSSLDLTVQLDSLLTTHLIASPDSVETQLNEGGIIQVTQWKDQSGYNYNAFPTNNTPPSFVENVLNGHPVIRFLVSKSNIYR